MALACEDIGPLRELAVYRPRRPQDTALHRVLSGNLETYLALRREDPEREALPDHLERTFRGYLHCGIPAHGTAVTDYVPSSGFTVLGDGDPPASSASGPAVRGAAGSG